MQLSEIMTAEVQVVDQGTSIRDAARKMKQTDVGAMPVVEDGTVVGMLSDRDLAVRAVADGMEPDETTVGELMTPVVIHLYEDQTVQEAAEAMKERRVRRLIVFNRDDEPTGMLSIGDLAVRGLDKPAAGELLEAVSEPAHPK